MRVDLLHALDSVSSTEQFENAVDGICRGAGLEHFLVAGLRGAALDQVDFIHHNAPAEARAAVLGLRHWSFGRLLETVRLNAPPAIFGAGAAAGLELPGFSSGVAYLMHGRLNALLVCFGTSAPALQPDAQMTVVQTVLLAATYGFDSLARLHAVPCPFTERELQCLSLARQGLTAKQTAQALTITQKRVEHILESARRACGADTTIGAATFAESHGWLQLQANDGIAASG